MARHLVLLFLLSTLAACSSLTTPRDTPAPVESIGGSRTTAPTPADNPVLQPAPDSGAVPLSEGRRPPSETSPSETWNNTELGMEVQNAIRVGNLAQAAALIERELGITPRDAFLWLQLSSIRLMENRLGEAEGMAQRALSLSRTPQMQSAANAQLQRIRATRS